MHSYTLILLSIGAATLLLMSSNSMASAQPTPQCSPSILLNADARQRQICFVLRQLANALDSSEEREMLEPIDNGIKRKDVDHVFLRFGRPRI